jgi:hypothetical protein
VWEENTRKYAQQIARKICKQANLCTSSCIAASMSQYQPGGVANCITGKWTGRIMDYIKDQSGMARWTGHILMGKNQQNIAVITAYRPTKAMGSQTTYQQQWRIIRNQYEGNPDPRAQMLKDLQHSIKSLIKNKCEIILLWDANESIGSHKSKIVQFMNETNLHPAHTSFPNATHTRGSQCIDFIMTTPGIQHTITKAGYLAF